MRKFFPSTLTPYDGQLKALEEIAASFNDGKRFFILEGPTGFGKSAVGKAVLNLCGKGFITSPLNSLVRQYAQDSNLGLVQVRGQSTYNCTAFPPLNCEQAADRFEDHSRRCMDYILARDAFWKADHGVTNLHFLSYAPPIEGAVYPRNVLVVDEAHNLENILISMCQRTISAAQVSAIRARPFNFPGEDRKQLNPDEVAKWLRYFESAIAKALCEIADGEEKRDYESLKDGINFTLECRNWITWKEKGSLVISPLSAGRAATRLFRCAGHILFMSATMGAIPLFLQSLGIKETDVAIHRAECRFAPENRKIIFGNMGSMSKNKGQPGLSPMLAECSRILRERPEDRGIIHCHSRELQRTVVQHLEKEFGNRILTHRSGNDRDAGVQRLRQSRNGVLCAVAMTEGLDLRDDDARFCIFAKIPWPNVTDPYIAARKRNSQDWYENATALAVVQGSGRVVRSEKDHADTFIFDSSFPMLVHRFPDWYQDAIRIRKKRPVSERNFPTVPSNLGRKG